MRILIGFSLFGIAQKLVFKNANWDGNSMLGILFGLVAMLGYGISNSMSQVPIKAIGSKRTIFFRNATASAFLGLATLFFLSETTISAEYVLIALGIAFLGYLPQLAYFRALKAGKVGVVSPIASSSVVFTVLFSLIFFNEVLGAWQVAAIASIVLGVIFISANPKDWKNTNLLNLSSGVPYALVAGVLWGLVYFLLKIPVSALGPMLSGFLLEFGGMVFSGINLKLSKVSFGIPDGGILQKMIIIGLLGGMGTMFFNLGIQGSDVSIVAAITFSWPMLAAIYAKYAYKEEMGLLQWAAAVLILAGIIVLSAG